MKGEGYGYEWDAFLVGGPADGCLDRVISINLEEPPRTIKRIVDGKYMDRETLEEKLIERLTDGLMDDEQKVAVYLLEKILEDDNCVYVYEETIKMKDFRGKYR
jgi:hypothetical protein